MKSVSTSIFFLLQLIFIRRPTENQLPLLDKHPYSSNVRYIFCHLSKVYSKETIEMASILIVVIYLLINRNTTSTTVFEFSTIGRFCQIIYQLSEVNIQFKLHLG